jgi:hypothetical protein
MKQPYRILQNDNGFYKVQFHSILWGWNTLQEYNYAHSYDRVFDSFIQAKKAADEEVANQVEYKLSRRWKVVYPSES